MNSETARTKLPRNQRAVIGAGIFIGLVVILQFYFRVLSPEAQDFQRFIQTYPLEKIKAIQIEPYAVSSLLTEPIVISDRTEIARIAEILRNAPSVGLNHPQAEWVAILRIVTEDREYGGQVERTRNQGVILSYVSQVQGGWNFGTVSAERLGPLLENLAQKPLASTQQPP